MAFLERLKLRRSASGEPGDEPGEAAAFAPPVAPKLKTRITELGQLLFPGRSARRLALTARLEDAPPDPAKILFPDGESGGGDGRAGQYREIADDLMRDARELDTVEARNADILCASLVSALIDRTAAKAAANMAFLVQAALMIAFIGFFGGLFYHVAKHMPLGAFGFGTLYLFLGAITAAFLVFLMDGAVAGALRRFRRKERDLVSLVEQTTSGFHQSLVALRATMEANSAGDFPKAIGAASEARLVTVSALRFFDRAPVVGAEAGEHCEVLMGAMRLRAGAGLRATSAMMLALVGALAAFVAGGAALYFTAAEPPQLAAIADFVSRLKAIEAATPGRVVLLVAVAVAVAAPMVFGPLLTLISASASPRSFLAAEPTRGLVNGMHAKALAAAAERKGELIERYADALLSLERRAQGWAARSAGLEAGDDTPAWRKPPEAPRFVEAGFQSAPKSFLVDAEDPGKAGRRRRARKKV